MKTEAIAAVVAEGTDASCAIKKSQAHESGFFVYSLRND